MAEIGTAVTAGSFSDRLAMISNAAGALIVTHDGFPVSLLLLCRRVFHHQTKKELSWCKENKTKEGGREEGGRKEGGVDFLVSGRER